MMWTAELVKQALVQAFEIDAVIGGRWKPRGYGSAMPDYLKEAKDFNEVVDIYESGGHYWGEMKSERRNKIQRQRIASIEEIKHMEIALLGHCAENGRLVPMWLGGLLEGNNGPRNCLEAYSLQSARANRNGKRFNETRFCRRVGWNVETYKSRRDRGAEILAFKLNQIGVPCWFYADGEQEQNCRQGKPPVTSALLDFISEKPRTRAQCISYAFTEGLIASRDKSHSIKVALTKLEQQSKIRKLATGAFALAG